MISVTYSYGTLAAGCKNYNWQMSCPGGLQLLRLLQLTDSAFPVGATAHSFGIESLVEEGDLSASNLESFFVSQLQENGAMEAAFCAAACRAALSHDGNWPMLNEALAARKPSRESRDASAAMGRRFLNLVSQLDSLDVPELEEQDPQYACAVGWVAGALSLDPETAALAYLQQSVTGLMSACLRLLPIGQTQAHQILWELGPGIAETASRAAAADPSTVPSFTALVELASMRHATLSTRLFIS